MKRLLVVLLVLLLLPVPLVLASGDMACAGNVVACPDALSADDSAASEHERHACSHCQAKLLGSFTLPVPAKTSIRLLDLAHGVLPNAPSLRPERPKWAPELRS